MENNIKKTSRYLAMETLDRIEKDQAYSNLAINHTIKENDLSRPDADLYTELVYGVTQRRLTLDYFLAPYVKKKIDSWVKQLLRLSVYQVAYLDRIPSHAVINEAVRIAKARGHKGIGNMVNAILRNIQRDGIRDLEGFESPVEKISVTYSLPKELVEKFITDFGMEETEKLAASLLKRAHASGRINRRFTTSEEVIEEAEEAGVNLQKSQVARDGLFAEKGNLAHLESFKKGHLTIQDESSMLVAENMSIEPSHRVLDACAAPGGKTTHIANFLDAEKGGSVTALDIHEHKVKLINENTKRQGFEDVVSAQVLDAKKADEVFEEESFDRVLVDAPCSGLGLARRKPDIKYTKTQEDFDRLKEVQLDILSHVAPLVKKDGLLVYSTCTIVKEENQEVIDTFLSENTDFVLQPLVNEGSIVKPTEAGYLSILPHEYETDGFFICAMKKIND